MRAFAPAAVAVALGAIAVPAAPAAPLAAITYTIRVPDPAAQVAEIEARVPTEGRATIELRMPLWTPGFYKREEYFEKVRSITASGPDGGPLAITQSPESKNRWTVETRGAAIVTVRYSLLADRHSVTTDWIGPELGVFNGAATFLTLAENARRPHEVTLELPPAWASAVTALDPMPNHWRAADYDELVDSPIVAGDLVVHAFEVDGRPFALVDSGAPPSWDGARAAADLERVVRANAGIWGDLPFPRYYFLNLFRKSGGGLEHKNSCLLSASAERVATPAGYRRWLAFVAHEFVHAWNVKRLRPIELGPFDYEREPHTPSLWISEGWTTYVAELALARGGLGGAPEFLADLSHEISGLEKEPGRHEQTLAQSSLEVWGNSLSGINPSAGTVSYYLKGAVAAFLLDARIRHATDGARSLDDVLRAAYARYGRAEGQRGFTPEEFRAVAQAASGVALGDWFRKTVDSTDDLDYREALDWYGLRFAPATAGSAPAASAAVDAASTGVGSVVTVVDTSPWTLEVLPDASDAQRARFAALLAPR